MPNRMDASPWIPVVMKLFGYLNWTVANATALYTRFLINQFLSFYFIILPLHPHFVSDGIFHLFWIPRSGRGMTEVVLDSLGIRQSLLPKARGNNNLFGLFGEQSLLDSRQAHAGMTWGHWIPASAVRLTLLYIWQSWPIFSPPMLSKQTLSGFDCDCPKTL
jgi:hypothetical protein